MDDKWDIEWNILHDKLRPKFGVNDKVTFNDGVNTRIGKVIEVYPSRYGAYYLIDIDNGSRVEVVESMLTLHEDKPVDILYFLSTPF